jgi:alkaline phosphatase
VLQGALLGLGVVAAAALVASVVAPWEVAVGNLVLRSQRGVEHPFPAPADPQPIAASRRVPGAPDDGVRPVNVVLVIGDGMGVGQVSTASALLHGPAGGLVLETAPVTGLMTTYAGDILVTDSAASATAMATGFKAPKKALSVLADGRAPATLFEAARAAGMATGVVTTSGLVDATPAGFTVHAEKRDHHAEILGDMLASGSEVLIGGDWSAYPKALDDAELQDMLARIDRLGADAGYSVVRDLSGLDRAGPRVLALFPPRRSGGDAHGPPLTGLAAAAIDRLAAGDRGFVLLVESEVTDGAGHHNDVAEVVDAVAELDAAVASILAWAEPRGDTLVIVTADHDTGGLGIVDGAYDDAVAEVRWATDGHTAQWVPVFAFGPGAHRFGGVVDNTGIARIVGDLLGLEGFPSVAP